jgi:hypothetical protein
MRWQDIAENLSCAALHSHTTGGFQINGRLEIFDHLHIILYVCRSCSVLCVFACASVIAS